MLYNYKFFYNNVEIFNKIKLYMYKYINVIIVTTSEFATTIYSSFSFVSCLY